LATLVFNTLRFRNVKLRNIPVITMIFAFMVAAADEFYQSHVPGRSPLIRDVFIDSMGAFTAVSVMLLKIKLRKSQKVSEPRDA
jgi:VanZ family protein